MGDPIGVGCEATLFDSPAPRVADPGPAENPRSESNAGQAGCCHA
jgi:hypothetical protein